MMSSSPLSRRRGAFAVVLLGLLAGASSRSLAADNAPAIPGAVTKPPEWLLEGAPFDVKAFFAPVPEAQNAAPLYLDALFEFSAEVLSCFPPSPERDRRAQAARDRAKRLGDVMSKLHNDPNSLPDTEIDPLMAEYGPGFERIYVAQQRPKCVFATGLGLDALLPHAQACRQVVVVAELRVRAWLKRGNIDAALSDLGAVLRMIRDLQPRGSAIVQLVCGALNNATATYLVVPILNAPGLTVAQCDRLIKLLAEHDALMLDGYAECLRSEYLVVRAAQKQLVEAQAELRKGLGLPLGKGSILQAILPPDKNGSSALGPGADALLAKTPPSVRTNAAKALSASFRARLSLADRTVGEQAAGQEQAQKLLDHEELLFQATKALVASLDNVAWALGRTHFLIRAAECQAALKRFELKHKKPTTDLAAACKDSGLAKVPLDPFNLKPIRAALIEGRPVVYSVGGDTKDDGGAHESLTGREPGDIVLSVKQKPY